MVLIGLSLRNDKGKSADPVLMLHEPVDTSDDD
jgi:hypothetical protein